MTSTPDLVPAVRRLSGVLAGVRDSDLAAPTPCEDYTVGDLADHVGGLTLAFTWAAEKKWPDGSRGGPSGDASRLEPDWRARFTERLDALAAAWRVPDAWQGMTEAGGVPLPGGVAGLVALNELVVHGWDLARATGQPYDCGQAELDACLSFVEQAAQDGDGGSDGPFGPAREVPDAAAPLDRLVALTGRDPSWTPPR
ncbi:TIGR03086 family metal-binding protein [Actinomadura rubrisoli]|uniref:TIGR03086 family protein n=1 Tax=Actinomadura rubrisoli TaxID=2530368 RepID=A0A4R5BPT2_9ACTN|nr:TIGR03086 family metal-binding protein [Actinomadura rubrisoli]TDD87383.1 TIGR03086 family protein [Actinomadura rubrisoli]